MPGIDLSALDGKSPEELRTYIDFQIGRAHV